MSTSQNRQRPQSALVKKSATPSETHIPSASADNKMRQLSSRNLRQTIDSTLMQKAICVKDPFSDQETRTVWRAFGSYIAKQLINGKGVLVPKFGLFSFTAPDVSLAGSTNPGERDRQLREPVFMVGKDFVSGIEKRSSVTDQDLRSGICVGDAIRPMALKGVSGIIPKVKVNYFEVAMLCSLSKDVCRDRCEQAFKYLSDRVRRGEQISTEIPLVGRFLVRMRVAAVNFHQDLVKQTKGATAKQFTVGNVFGSLDATHNLNMLASESKRKNTALADGKQAVTQQAQNWLRENLGIDVNAISPTDPVLSPPISQRRVARCDSAVKSQLHDSLSFDNLNNFDQNSSVRSRPQSSYSSRRSTAAFSTVSNLPAADRFQLMQSAASIQKKRKEIAQHVNLSHRFRLRDKLASSQILIVLKNVGVDINIMQLKQLLRELGFKFNGPSVSLAVLIKATKQYLQGTIAPGMGPQDSDDLSDISQLTGQSKLGAHKQAPDVKKAIDQIRDMLYASGRTLFNVFRSGIGMNGKQLDRESFLHILNEISGGHFPPQEASAVFASVAKAGGISYERFESTFRSEIPTSIDMETKVIRVVREWLFRNRLSSEAAFDQFCHTVGVHQQKKLDRSQFHTALVSLEVGLQAAQVDGLFNLLVEEGSFLTLELWQAKIYEDSGNPLQMIREVVAKYGLTQDDLMLQMKLKLWDEPLSASQLTTAIRQLDQSISDVQISALHQCLRQPSGLVPVPVLIQNLTGRTFETVDFRDEIYKQLYSEIYPHKEEQLISYFQDADKENKGFLRPADIFECLKKCVTTITFENLERFCRFLETNRDGQLEYTDFMSRVTGFAPKTHNPFRNIVNRLSFFLKHNKISAKILLHKLGKNEVPAKEFAEFLKAKVDKRAELHTLLHLTNKIDVDRDGFVTEVDIETCIKNLQNASFWKHKTADAPVEVERAKEVIEQITKQMGQKKVSYHALFNMIDTNQDGMVSLAEFQRGLLDLISLSGPVVEQLYRLMDKNRIDLVSYDQFLDVLKAQNFKRSTVRDNFEWEQQTIAQIKQWLERQSLTAEEAFKVFDKDFDGKVSKSDLKTALLNNIQVPSYQITETKLDRLFKLLDTFKAGHVSLPDFLRVTKSHGTPNWKAGAIQQFGVLISHQHASLNESFAKCSQGSEKVNFEKFKAFIAQNDILKGFNLTQALLQELFSHLDPHKKGYLSYNDWKIAFGKFNAQDHLLWELKNIVSCQFLNFGDAFTFLLSFADSGRNLNQAAFEKAVYSLSNERFSGADLAKLWATISENGLIDQFVFRKHFGALIYTGNLTMSSVHKRGKSTPAASHTTSQQSRWATNVIEKLKGILRCSTRPMKEIFDEFNPDGDGQITQVEFRNAIRKLNLGLSSKEIDNLMARIDANADGLIDYNEFAQKLGTTQQDNAMQMRAADRLGKLKELMILHLTSPTDAFRYFDERKEGTLTFAQFNRLVTKSYEVAHLRPPTYPVVKDLFELIDARKDGVIDVKEWNQTFGKAGEGNQNLSVKTTALSGWENSREFEKIGSQMARNRKLIIQNFKTLLQGESKDGQPSTLFTFSQGKKALDGWLYQHFRGQVSDAQLKCLFGVAQVPSESQHEPRFDYMRLLDVYKARYAGPQK